MKTKQIKGATVRQNQEYPKLWDVMETRAGKLTGKSLFTGTLKEIRKALPSKTTGGNEK